jgi:eukaryotic-like serine/threonine-protein kinase
MTAAEEIFAAARELDDPKDRAAFLDRACGNDSDLRAQVEALLRDAAAAREYFGETEAGAGAVLGPERPLAEGPGTVIGRYKLLEQIGEGGMGVVYMAEQREPVARRVAFKIIKLGLDT